MCLLYNYRLTNNSTFIVSQLLYQTNDCSFGLQTYKILFHKTNIFRTFFLNNSPPPHCIVLIFNTLQQCLNCAYLFICTQKSKKKRNRTTFSAITTSLD